ncbi:thioredoxin family protein [Chitinophaga varians]|uniref:thioredoxin family protein n=1 Tax=Chitinophaga varians TaxID=2202339 RepID=UPI00165F748F|nr:thioredoxin domain-containing protein [Chitinophaga varians]MBC9909924.1 thioredoxin family protein [Chitinophaga varians]
MKKLIFFCTLIFTAQLTRAQNGISFFNGSWKEVQEEATRQQKMIFVDVYTEWCGPCKYMDREVFTDTTVARKYAAHFIAYKLDAEKGEGVELSRRYNVGAYPTFLFLNSGGYVVHKVTGEREKAPFIGLADVAVKAGADKHNPGNLEKLFAEGDRSPQFLRDYLRRLAEADLDNSEVLDAYFKTIPAPVLEDDSTLLFFARHVNGTHTATVVYLMNHYHQLSDTAKAKVSGRLFEKLVRNGAGLALKEKRLLEYNALLAFGRQLSGLQEGQQAFLNRLDLVYSSQIRDYQLLKKAGYIMAARPYAVSTDAARAEDKRRYDKIMQPFLTGEKDSTKIPGFAEERKIITEIYSREISEQLYTAAKAFVLLPSSENKALTDALLWAKRCEALMPGTKPFIDLIKELEEKKK